MVKICMKNTRALYKDYKKKKMTIRSKHNDLMNYFIHDERDLSPAYLASCRKFFKELSNKRQAASVKQLPQSDAMIDPLQKINRKELKKL